jgi:HEAT repeat protein
VRAAAIALAASDVVPASTDALIVALDDADEHVQSAALDALAESGQAERLAVLSRVAAIALRDARWWMRRRAVFALAHAASGAAAAPLAQVLAGDRYVYVREAAAEALGEARAAGAIDALAAACAEDAEPRVRPRRAADSRHPPELCERSTRAERVASCRLAQATPEPPFGAGLAIN